LLEREASMMINPSSRSEIDRGQAFEGFVWFAHAIGGPYAVALMLGDESQAHCDRDAMEVRATAADVLRIVVEVGESLGFIVDRIDRKAAMVWLTSRPPMEELFGAGGGRGAGLQVALKERGGRLQIDYEFKADVRGRAYERALEVVSDLKVRVQQRVMNR
jgi:hypothetical protein